jgi:PAS domain S-box-containing protein
VLTRFWHRRICEAAFLISAAIITLYFWNFFGLHPIVNRSLAVDMLSVILASVTAFISFVSYLWVPRKAIFPVALVIYLLLSTTTATLIIDTGDVSSPFVALWMLMSIFAGVFELWGTIPILIAISAFTAIKYITGDFPIESMIITIFSGLLPLIIGAIIWYKKSGNYSSNDDDRAYRNLANELTEVANKSEFIINAIGDGVVAIDSKGSIQLINPAAQLLIGWGKQDALTLNYKSVLQMVNQKNETLDIADDPIQQVLNNNQQVRTNDTALMTKSGKKITISMVVSPVGDIGSGIIAVFHDITKEKATEREQAEFISTASHEMRTPVASIEGYLGLAINPQTAQIDDRARNFILKAHAAAEHLGHLFQDLLDVSKADDGRISNNPKIVDIVTFTHDIVEGLMPQATQKGLHLIYKPIPDNTGVRVISPVYSVNLDNDHIREVINNLIENAIKYSPQGEIVVDITGDEEYVIISIKDSGIGIPAEDIPHLFQKFYRVDNENTREIGGTGLGLYLSRRLVEIMGGRIWAESVYNQGSIFYVELPRISGQETNLITEQETLIAQEEARQKGIDNGPPQTASTQSPQDQPIMPSITSNITNNVPRSQALTPEQIANYVAKQRALIQQQNSSKAPTNRPQPVPIPVTEQKS